MALREVLARFGIEVAGQEKLVQVTKNMKKVTNGANALARALKKSREEFALSAAAGYLPDRDVESVGKVGKAAQKSTKDVRILANAWKVMRVIWIGKQVIGGIKSFIDGTIEAADALQHNAEKLGITTDELQQYQYAASLVGVTAKETAIGFRFFDRALGEAQLGTKGAVKTFAQLGLSIRDANGNFKPTDEMLFEFADKLKGVKTQAERVAFASKLLGRNGAALLPMLQLGSKALREMFKDVEELGGGFNKDFVEAAHKTDIQLKRMQMGMRGVSVAIAKELMPWIDKSIARTIHQIKVFIDFAKHTYGVKTALMALAATVSFLMGVWLAFNPHVALMVGLFAAFAAIVGGLYLVFDDLYTSMEGGDSYFTDFLEKMGGKGAALTFWIKAKEIFNSIKDALFGASDGSNSLAKNLMIAFKDSIPWMVKWGGIFLLTVVKSIDMAVTSLHTLLSLMANSGDAMRMVSETKRIWAEYNNRQNPLNDAILLLNSINNPVPPDQRTAKPGDGVWAGPLQGGSNGRYMDADIPPIVVNNTFNGPIDPGPTERAVKKGVVSGVKSAAAAQRDAHAAVNAGMPQSTGP